MAKKKESSGTTGFKKSIKVKRSGIHSKKRSSNLKSSKNYKKIEDRDKQI